jgi:hypothetical protein
MQTRERLPEPAHNVLLLLGMAAVSWAAIGLASAALWPRQPEFQPVSAQPVTATPLTVQEDWSPSVTVHNHSDVAEPGSSRKAARQAVRRKVKLAAKRRHGPSFAARVFSATTN